MKIITRIFILWLFFLTQSNHAQTALCPSTATQFCCEYVQSVTFNGVTFQGNTGFTGPGYYNYSSTPMPILQAGTSVPLSVVVRTNGPYQQFVKFWIDFNNNGNLEDEGELVFDQTQLINNTTFTFSGNILVPQNAFNGPVRMRLIMQFSASPTLCGEYAYGNTFDFGTSVEGGVDPVQLTVNKTGTGNVVSNPTGINTATNLNFANFGQNTNVILTATPIAPQTFIGWSGDASGTTNPLTVTMDQAKTITANFASNSPPTVTTLSHSNLTSNSVTLSANVTGAGSATITSRGFYYGTTNNPTTNLTTVSGTTGIMTSNIVGLQPYTVYYYRAFATNSVGTTYTTSGTFTTSYSCATIDQRSNGNGQANLCPGVSGTPTNPSVTSTVYANVPVTAKTGNIRFKYTAATLPGIIPAIGRIWINGVQSTAQPGPPSVTTTSGGDYLVTYCFYNINLPNAGNYTLEFINPATGEAVGRCTFDGSTNVTTTEPTLLSNTNPTISAIANQTICQAATPATVNFTIGDTETTDLTLMTVSATSSNTTLLPNANLVLGGTTAARTLNYTFAAGQTGTTTITITVVDPSGGTAIRTFTITHLTSLVLNAASQTNIACFGNDTGAASVSAATGGAGGYTYNWTPGNPTGDGTTSVTGLTAGTWTCTVTDANGCTASRTFTITQPSSALALTAASQTNIACNGNATGAASVNAATGGSGGYTYNWTPGNPTGDGTTSVSGLTAGTWTCTVTDANGCTASQSFVVTQPTALVVASNSQTQESCPGANNATASVSISGGAGGYTYSWSPSGGNASSASGLSAGTYTVTATDANGCQIAHVFTITAIPNPNISYSQSAYTLYSGNAISSLTPSNSGGPVTAWTIAPALPLGLSINPSTGVISGTPADGFSNTTYTITGTNGSCNDNTTIELNALTCYGFNANDMILRGNATISGGDVTLTTASGNQFGALWSTDRLDLTKDFRVKSQLYFGNNDAGADGLAFVIQPLSSNEGSAGGGIGYAGINPSLAIEFDTYFNSPGDPYSNDHMAIMTNGNTTNHTSPIDLGNIEDNAWHDFEVSWTASTNNLKVYYDGSLRYNQTIDIVNNIFSGNENAYFGFTAATGGAVNTQAVRLLESCLTRILNLPPTVTTIDNFNSCFNQTTSAQSFTISDDTTPIANISVTATSSNTTLVPNNQITITGSGATKEISLTPVTGQFGTTTITIVVEDQEGLSVSESFTVTIDDTVAPTVVTQNVTIQLDSNGNANITTGMINNGSSDNCDIDTITLDTTSFNCSNVGNNTVTLTVTDVKGNSSSNTAVVTVEDNINPTVLFTQNITIQLNASGTASISTSDIDNGSFDNCGIASMTLSQVNFDCSHLGNNTVVYTVVDNNGNTVTQNVTVTVLDNINPVAIGQNITVSLNADGQFILDPALIDNGSYDNCDYTLTASPNIFGPANIGVNNVILVITDSSGNSHYTVVQVTITDNVNPVVNTQNITINLDSNGLASITANQVNNGSTDNAQIASMSVSPDSFTCDDLGANTVTLTVTDTSGNNNTGTATVTLVDNINPTITAPAAVTTTTNTACTATGVTLGTPVTADNCSVASVTNDAPASFPIGNTTVTWTVVDGSGNTATATQVVTVTDVTNPTITAPAAVTVPTNNGCFAVNVVLGTPVTADNCSIASVTNDAPATFPLGTTTVTWTIVDGSSNTATATQVVTVIDTQLPSIIAPIAINTTTNTDCTRTGLVLGNAITTDNCSVASVTNDAPAAFPLGTTTVTWTVVDGSGNTATATQIVTVTDVTLPTITAPAAVNVNTNATCTATGVSLGTPVTADNCSVASVTNNAPATFPLGTTTVTWTVVDGSGNTATATQLVTVTDVTNPTITAPSNVVWPSNIGCYAVNVLLGSPGVADNCSIASISNNAPFVFPLGTTTVTWTVVDGSGNTATATQTVTIVDIVAPALMAPVAINTITNSGCTATGVILGNPIANDNCSSVTVTNNAPVAFPLGTTTVTWTVVDGSGNTATATQIVTVTDATLPTITAPAAVNVSTNTACIATGVSLGTPITADNCSVASVTNNAPAAFPLGTTTVTWTVVDGSGNTATATQVVTVTDVTVPTITAPAAVTVPTNNGCFAVNVALGTPVTADNCSIASVINDAPATFPLGATTVTWTVVDGSGNTATATQIVTIVDTQLPSIIAPIAINTTTNTNCTRTGLVLGNAITTDNCSVTSVTNNAPAAFPLGTTTVTWTVVDGSGNTATATQIVTVTDATLPIITAPAAVNVNANSACTATGVSLGTPLTADNCSVASVTNNAPAAFSLGTTTVTWTVVDGSGNTATATQVVTVTDVTVPTITAPAAVTVSTNNGCFAVNVALGTPVTADNCSIASVTNDAQATFPLGTTTVTWTIVDGSGNTATATQVVTVIDTQLPTIVAPIAINTTTNTGCTRTGLVLGNPVAMDNCSVASVTNDAPMAFPVGSTTVTWTVTDGSGNTATATQLVTVTDIITPTVITQNISIRLNGNGIANIVAGDVNNGTFDNCAIATLVVSPSTFNCQNVGPNTVTLTATDIYGNSASATAIVTVIDPVAPIAIAQNATVILDEQGMASITADMINNNSTDNCAIASISVNIVNFNCNDLGTNTVILTVTDFSGNTATATAIVTVVTNDIDTDFDGIKNNCDDDDDNDGVLDVNDNCILQFNPDQNDFDEDGLGNACDDDDDNDGVIDTQDNCQFGYNPFQEDRDNDGIGDLCDVIEINPSEAITPNGDGINDTWIIHNIENHPNNTVKVYNRWGDLVFNARGYRNEWNGYYKNREQSLPDGSSYYYQIDLDGNGTVDHEGWLYITRN